MAALLLALLAVAALLAIGAGLIAIRRSGSHPGLARRYAGAGQHRVGDLLDMAEPPARAVRVVGRVRCADPIHTADDDTLVAVHRDVDVRLARGGWRTIDRLRETRSFDLWDHDGSLTVDPSGAAEPIIAIPHVWRGPVAQLDAAFGAAVERLRATDSTPLEARSITRMVSTVDRVGLLAVVRRDPAGLRLEPPRGGFVLSVLDLDASMRLLGGPRRRLMLAGFAGLIGGAVVLVLSAAAAVLQLLG